MVDGLNQKKLTNTIKRILMKRKYLLIALFSTLFFCANIFAQSTYPVNVNQNILHYTFNLSVNDTSNVIEGEATILFTLQDQDYLMLDFVGLHDGGVGMHVNEITYKGKPLPFTHKNNRLRITIDSTQRVNNSSSEITIHYKGTPENGLIIAENLFGQRVFFGDNYPDRARHWLPCVDHPSDKASVTWQITAPTHYKVIANGKWVDVKEINKFYHTTTWNEQVPISTKVMVFGAANFATEQSGEVNGVLVSTWVYDKNSKNGFNDFAIAPKVLTYFDSLIAPYPYEKLANVQSKTMYGGMENAGNIFYFENAVNGRGERENLIAHEIVHQWFGNSATEKDWPHAWLSEGFATYLTHVYVGSKKGLAQMNKRLITDREKIIKYWHTNPLPIVNYGLVSFPAVEELDVLLNMNTYQKGGWVLHMLRNELGDDVFWKSVRMYYNIYKNKTSDTNDFQKVLENVSGKDLKVFFNQWLYGMGQPELTGEWKYGNGEIIINITQTQENLFNFPLELGLVYKGKVEYRKVNITSKNESFRFSVPKPVEILLDPNTQLLFEGDSILKRK